MATDISIVLPSYKPDEKLEMTVNSFHEAGFDDIIVVDDGGGAEYKEIFDRIRALEYCTVLTHEVNRGKGAALKTAFAYYQANRKGMGVITADGDGQHKASDAVRMADEMRANDRAGLENVLLGVRDFSGKDIPFRSRFGNKFTSLVFRLMVGMKVSDTQTGFRGIPSQHLTYMLNIKGERYEYETNMLMYLKRWCIPYEEFKIETIYIDDNKTSHFRPVKDSLKIYKLIFIFMLTGVFVKYICNSLLCYVIDYSVFWFVQSLLLDTMIADVFIIGIAYCCGRAVSSVFNFLINRKIFKSEKSKTVAIKYFILVIVLLFAGTVLDSVITSLIVMLVDVGETGTKLISSAVKFVVDFSLFFASFNVQKNHIFNKKEKKD